MSDTKPSGISFELWDLVSRNVVGEFSTELQALALLRALAEERGWAEANSFALVREDEHGDSVTLAAGSVLVDLALGSQRPSVASAS